MLGGEENSSKKREKQMCEFTKDGNGELTNDVYEMRVGGETISMIS